MYLCVCVYTVYGLGLGLVLVIYIQIYITGVYKINYIFAIIYNDWKQCIPIGQAGLQIFLGGGERRGGLLRFISNLANYLPTFNSVFEIS